MKYVIIPKGSRVSLLPFLAFLECDFIFRTNILKMSVIRYNKETSMIDHVS